MTAGRACQTVTSRCRCSPIKGVKVQVPTCDEPTVNVNFDLCRNAMHTLFGGMRNIQHVYSFSEVLMLM